MQPYCTVHILHLIYENRTFPTHTHLTLLPFWKCSVTHSPSRLGLNGAEQQSTGQCADGGRVDPARLRGGCSQGIQLASHSDRSLVAGV